MGVRVRVRVGVRVAVATGVDVGALHGIVALNDLAAITIAQGDFVHARELSAQSHPLARVLNDRLSTAFALATGGQAARSLGEYDDAQRQLTEALTLFQQSGYKASVAGCFENLAAVAGRTGHYLLAARLYGAAEALRERIGVAQEPPSVQDYERNLAAIREQVDARTWGKVWAEGRVMSLEQAVSCALTEQ